MRSIPATQHGLLPVVFALEASLPRRSYSAFVPRPDQEEDRRPVAEERDEGPSLSEVYAPQIATRLSVTAPRRASQPKGARTPPSSAASHVQVDRKQ